MWQQYHQPTSLPAALDLLAHYSGSARIVAGGTDLVIEAQRGLRPTATLIDISRIQDLRYVRADGDRLTLGGLATHNDVLASPLCREHATPLVQACLEVGAPQIRTRATIAGNLVTASPANDTITPLIALGADLVLASAWGEREVRLQDFYPGFRQTTLRPDELVREIRFPTLGPDQRGHFVKLGLRRAQAISVINLAVVITFSGDHVQRCRIALGCLAPTVVRARTAEGYLAGKKLTAVVCSEAARLACEDVRPIDDLRGSAGYRLATLASLLAATLEQLADGGITPDLSATSVLLDTGDAGQDSPAFDGAIETIINGQSYRFVGAAGKTLLDALREHAGLTGAKEGCAEGECGACTVWLNGQAVMSCLVPAPQAHGARLTTIEGLRAGERLHPLQEAFVSHGAVQCGFCIPGMLMAGAKLLDEHPAPDLTQVQTALSGNICRCTGYRKILDAMGSAGGVRI
jgi:carbon-monoxide dehydrogenase medium subunit